MKIFVAQIKSIAGDVSGNFARIQAAYKRALEAKCDICLLPELATSGYLAEDLFLSPDFISEIAKINTQLVLSTKECALILPTVVKPSLRGAATPATSLRGLEESVAISEGITKPSLRAIEDGVAISGGRHVRSHEIATSPTAPRNDVAGLATPRNDVVGLTAPRHDVLYNAAIVAQNGKILGQTHKTYLPNYGVFDEKRYFIPGKPEVIVINGRKIGIPICEDIWYPEVCADLKAQGAEIFLVPNASPYEIGKFELRLKQIVNRYNETKLPFVFCNQAHAQDGIIFDGNSFCYDGKLSMICNGFEEDNREVMWEGAASPTTSLRGGCLAHVAISGGLHVLSHEIAASPTTPRNDVVGLAPPRHDELQSIYQAITFGLKSYVQNNGFSKVILGISGGIDSALVATICCDALGAENVTGYMMPTSITSQESKDDANKLAKLLGIKLETIEIDEILNAYISTMDAASSAKEQDLMYQNLQARIRGTMLMAQSNKHNSLLITTGNKSEYATGYATLYGDMNGAFNPIKDLYKTQIFALARYRNTIEKVIPDNIITKAPSAELASGQRDSDSLPEYEILDKILYDYIECNLPREELYNKFEPSMVDKVIKLVKNSEFKRKQSAPGVKVSKRNFEKDRRFPITNGFV